MKSMNQQRSRQMIGEMPNRKMQAEYVEETPGRSKKPALTPATAAIMVTCVLVFLFQLVTPGFSEKIALDPNLAADEPQRFVFSMFAHAGFIHLIVNMYALRILGPQVEEILGSVRFLILYFAAGVIGAITFLAIGPDIPAVGASAALFGLLGFVLPFTRYNWRVILIVLFNMLLGFAVPQIAWEAHLGGLVAGFALGLYFYHKPQKQRTGAQSGQRVFKQ